MHQPLKMDDQKDKESIFQSEIKQTKSAANIASNSNQSIDPSSIDKLDATNLNSNTDIQASDNQSTSPQEIIQNATKFNDSIFELEFEIRQETIYLLSHLAALLLFDGETTLEYQKKLSKSIDDIILLLVNLPLKSMNTKPIVLEPILSPCQMNARFYFDFSDQDRFKLIELLIKNKSTSILYKSQYSPEQKNELSNNNIKMIEMLLKLNFGIRKKALNTPFAFGVQTAVSPVVSNNGDSTIKPKVRIGLFGDKSSENSKKFDFKQLSIDEKFNLTTSSVSKFVFEVKNASVHLLQNHTTTSNMFKCANIDWNLTLVSTINGNHIASKQSLHDSNQFDVTQGISLNLKCNNFNDKSNWSIRTSYELTLINQKSFVKNKIISVCHVFRPLVVGFVTDLISIYDLKNKDEGFIKDDKIWIQIDLRVLEIKRD